MSFLLKTVLILLAALASYAGLQAQKTTAVTIKAGNKISDHLPSSEIYAFPQFTSGNVFFKDGTKAEARLNYNYLVDEMHFIDRKGDTLALDNENTIKHIAIGTDTFYYNQGYFRLIRQNKEAILAFKQVWALGDIKKSGAFNMPSSSGAITTISSFVGRGGNYNLALMEDMDLKKLEYFILGDQYNHFSAAGKKNLLLLFPMKQQAIKSYLQESKVDFNNKEDLVKLVQFLALH